MPTPNIIVLGSNNNNNEKKPLKPIELKGCVKYDLSGINHNIFLGVTDFLNVELIAKGGERKNYNYDLILCYNNDRNQGNLYYGNWNDGVAE